jgi:predicted enzyme related to lactoylglutathione lyase
MPIRLISIVFQAKDPETLAKFWRGSTEEWSRRQGMGGEVHLVPSEFDGSTLDIVFSPGSPKKVGKNRIHLDVNSHGDYARRRDELRYFDVPIVDIGQGELVPWTVYADPEGNEWCLLKSRDRYNDTGDIAAIVVDCTDPGRLVSFWAAATGWEIIENDPGFASLRATPDSGPLLEFSKVDNVNPSPSPVSLGFESYWEHQHDDDVAKLVELGARLVRTHEDVVSYSVLADPEGNEFRVISPVWPPPPPRQRARF